MRITVSIVKAALIALAWLTHQCNALPAVDRRQPVHQPPTCDDPLSRLAPDAIGCGQFNGSGVVTAAYIMSTDGCPAKVVCLDEDDVKKATAPCSGRQSTMGQLVLDQRACPDWAPVAVLEHAGSSAAGTVGAGLPACPLRPRCIRLDCFDDFCRARRRRRDGGAQSSRGPASRDRPLLVSNSNGCSYLRCGCPHTEADLLAQGCASPSDQLILQADPLNGCPAKLCMPKLPSWIAPLPLEHPHSNVLDCSNSLQQECPPGTSELTMASALPGQCPLRVCLLPELLKGNEDATTTDSSTTVISATTTAPVDSSHSTESTTSEPPQPTPATFVDEEQNATDSPAKSDADFTITSSSVYATEGSSLANSSTITPKIDEDNERNLTVSTSPISDVGSDNRTVETRFTTEFPQVSSTTTSDANSSLSNN